MDFQPRLGVVTRALQQAGPDLLHFFLVAGSVFICYCMMGFLIFGNSLHWFATFGASLNTCFNMLLGEFADANADLRALGGLQVIGSVVRKPLPFYPVQDICTLCTRCMHVWSPHGERTWATLG